MPSKKHDHHHKPKKPNPNTFFSEPVITVTVVTKVNEPQENCLTGCFKALFTGARKAKG